MIRFEPGLSRIVLDLQLKRSLRQSGEDFIEQGGTMTRTQVQLLESGPRRLGDDVVTESRVVGQDQLPVFRAAHVELDGIGNGYRRGETGEGVVRKPARPPSVGDYRHREIDKKNPKTCLQAWIRTVPFPPEIPHHPGALHRVAL